MNLLCKLDKTIIIDFLDNMQDGQNNSNHSNSGSNPISDLSPKVLTQSDQNEERVDVQFTEGVYMEDGLNVSAIEQLSESIESELEKDPQISNDLRSKITHLSMMASLQVQRAVKDSKSNKDKISGLEQVNEKLKRQFTKLITQSSALQKKHDGEVGDLKTENADLQKKMTKLKNSLEDLRGLVRTRDMAGDIKKTLTRPIEIKGNTEFNPSINSAFTIIEDKKSDSSKLLSPEEVEGDLIEGEKREVNLAGLIRKARKKIFPKEEVGRYLGQIEITQQIVETCGYKKIEEFKADKVNYDEEKFKFMMQNLKKNQDKVTIDLVVGFYSDVFEKSNCIAVIKLVAASKITGCEKYNTVNSRSYNGLIQKDDSNANDLKTIAGEARDLLNTKYPDLNEDLKSLLESDKYSAKDLSQPPGNSPTHSRIKDNGNEGRQ